MQSTVKCAMITTSDIKAHFTHWILNDDNADLCTRAIINIHKLHKQSHAILWVLQRSTALLSWLTLGLLDYADPCVQNITLF